MKIEHRWRYARLTQLIVNLATMMGLMIEEMSQQDVRRVSERPPSLLT
jgi:hypothetical protein